MECRTVVIDGQQVQVDADLWDTELRTETSVSGLWLERVPSSMNWRIEKRKHTSYVFCSMAHGLRIRLHRLMTQAKRNQIIDHVNGDGLDNRSENLRIATAIENARNRAKTASRTSSVYVGVCWHKQHEAWYAYAKRNYRHVSLGLHATQEAAAKARDEFVSQCDGEFANLNTP